MQSTVEGLRMTIQKKTSIYLRVSSFSYPYGNGDVAFFFKRVAFCHGVDSQHPPE